MGRPKQSNYQGAVGVRVPNPAAVRIEALKFFVRTQANMQTAIARLSKCAAHPTIVCEASIVRMRHAEFTWLILILDILQ